jgi:histidyl-tRNA synthetase
MAADEISFRAPRGTRDLVPPESWAWQELSRLAQDSFERAGYAPVETPAFEHTEVFSRGVGEASEVVHKQMYTFSDQGGRSLTLRPEGTAAVMRAVLERNLQRGPLPVKLNYSSSMFRQERPQKGRFRAFWQVGIEAIGSLEPSIDAEVIEVGHRFLLDAETEPRLFLNSIGHPGRICRDAYLSELRSFLRDHSSELSEADRERAEANPLRTFDSKEPATIAALEGAPLILDHICEVCRDHFRAVQDLLTDLEIDFVIEPRLVRGLDYYTRTAFEWVSSKLGSQSALCGGGRYDGLSEALGGPPLGGIGFACGIDRIMLARAGTVAGSPVRVYIVALSDAARRMALKLASSLRAAGIGCDLDHFGRGLKGQMKDADRSGAEWAVILGQEELAEKRAALKNLRTQEQEQVPWHQLEKRLQS